MPCPGRAEYGHGFSRTTVHAGCCERWAETLGHDWHEAGDQRRDWDDWERAGRFAECSNCGKISRDPRGVTEECPA